MKKIGFVDYFIDEWHANNYPTWMKESPLGGEYTVAYTWAEIDTPPAGLGEMATRKWCEKFGTEQCASIEELCERENCKCEDHFALSALKHTLRITLFILVISFAINAIIHLAGEEFIASLLLGRPVLGNLVAAMVGLIPNCASSVAITNLYLESVISAGAMMSGLLVNSGIALTILFRNNRPVKDSLRVLCLLFLIGLSCGILIDLTGFLPL